MLEEFEGDGLPGIFRHHHFRFHTTHIAGPVGKDCLQDADLFPGRPYFGQTAQTAVLGFPWPSLGFLPPDVRHDVRNVASGHWPRFPYAEKRHDPAVNVGAFAVKWRLAD